MQKHFALPTFAAALSLGALAPMMDGCAPVDRPTDCSARNSRGESLAVLGLADDSGAGHLVCFQSSSPGQTKLIGGITGLQGDTELIGIDYRVQDNKLYGVGNAGGIYTINELNAAATKVSQLNGATLSGTSFGVDFNPAADRLRIISDNGQNLRTDVTTGATTVDTPLNIPGATPVNPATGVTGAGYTNNDLDANTATTLFDIDGARDQVVVQSPANSGQLAATGKLLVDAGEPVGFDIYSVQSGATTAGQRALASFSAGGSVGLYKINLVQGRATGLGAIGSPVQDVAIPLAQS